MEKYNKNYFLKILMTASFYFMKDATIFTIKNLKDMTYVFIVNITFENSLLYLTRQIMGLFLFLTTYSIGTMNSNPIIKVVEKHVKDIPKSEMMTSDEIKNTKVFLQDFMSSMKIISTSLLSILLTRFIKNATVARRTLISNLANEDKLK